jgi:hypothetical protein
VFLRLDDASLLLTTSPTHPRAALHTLTPDHVRFFFNNAIGAAPDRRTSATTFSLKTASRAQGGSELFSLSIYPNQGLNFAKGAL